MKLLRYAWLLAVFPAATPCLGGITHSQQASNSDISGTAYSSFGATFASPTTSGNAILVGVTFGNDSTVTVTDTQGNTYAQAIKTYDSRHNQGSAIFYATNITGSSSNTVTVNFSSAVAYLALGIHEYIGIATSSPLDVTSGATGTGTGLSSGPATTTANGDLIFSCGVEDAAGSGDTLTAGSGFTKRVDLASAAAYADEDQIQSSAGPIAATWTLSPSGLDWIADMAAFKASTGPPGPTITSVSPLVGPVGSSVTITGTNLGTTQGTSTVTFNGTAASTTSWSATSIIATVPGGASPGNVVITVAGKSSNPVSFIVGTISHVQQASNGDVSGATYSTFSATFGSATTTGNAIILGLSYGIQNPTITVTDSQGNTYTQAIATYDSGHSQGCAVFYATGITGGSTNTVTAHFGATVAYLALGIHEYTGIATSSALDVASGQTGTYADLSSGSATTADNGDLIFSCGVEDSNSGGDTFIAGSGFTKRVDLGMSFAYADEDRVQASAGPIAATWTLSPDFLGWIAVMATFKTSFTGSGGPGPNITGLSPTSGPVGTSVTITGTNFGASQGTSTVTFNGIAATPTSWSATSIVVPVPSGATTGNVVVTVSGVASNGVVFTVAPVPTITGFSPTSASGGALITVSGTNFTGNGASPLVTLNQQGGGTIPASVSSASATSLSFVIPTGAATGAVTVTANGQNAVSSSTLTITASTSFTLTATPSSATLLPGQTATYQVSLASTNGFTQLANLAVSGMPTGVTASFQPPQITAGQFSILTVTAPANQAPGATQLTITASAVVQGITQNPTTTATLSVQALGGVMFAGRVAVTDAYETPLVGVTVRMMGVNQNGVSTGCTGSIPTDGSGNFVLNGLSASCGGGQLIQYDPSTVTSPPGTYSGVTLSYSLTSGQVTTPGIIVHLPRVNNAETVLVQQGASVDQTFAFATVPGVTITVYAHTTFTLADGTTQPNPFPLSVVEIPIDRLPEKMPPDPTQDPVFAMSIEPFNSSSSQPIAVSYPNRSKIRPGTGMPLTSLNPTLGMMVNYGTATVSADGTQIVPDFDSAHPGHRFGISHFDWHFPEPGPNANNPCPDAGNCPKRADPVDLASGLFSFTKTDIVLGGARGQVVITRTFRGATTNVGPFGIGTNHNYSHLLDASNVPGGLINLVMPDGNQIPFVQSGGIFVNTTIPSAQGAVISNVSCSIVTGCTATLRWKNGTVFQFQSFNYALSSALFIGSITDANGNKTTLVHGGSAPNEITQIIDPVGRTLNLTYDLSQRITSITDPIGRIVRYTYTAQGYLQTVTDANSPAGVTTYGYDPSNNLQSITDARSIPYLTNTYDSNGRVLTQTAIDGGMTKFNYTPSNQTIPTSPVLLTTVTDPLGNQTTYHFNPAGFVLDVTDALGRKIVYTRDPGTNLLLSVTDPLNRTTTFTYDTAGNTTSITRLAGAFGAMTTSFTYDPVFNKLASITDPLGHITLFSYDKAGNLVHTKDPLNPPSTLGYDGAGELISVTDPLSNPPTQIGYDGFGNVTQTVDPLGRKISTVSDAVGRTQTSTNALGETAQSQYSPLNQFTQITDPLNGQTSFTYDPNGNLLTLTDALRSGHVTTYTYDNMDRLATRKDPLPQNPAETYQYDLDGNVVQFTDRRGKVTTYKYDALNRKIFAGFGTQLGSTYESTISYSYDAGDRVIQVADSTSGTITRSYDGLDRLTSEVSPRGSVSYAYDAAGRRTSMVVSGQTAVTYTFDNANRLTQISQGSTNVSFGYDNDSRRNSLTLPNGVTLNYAYDAASQLTGINYTLGSNTLGNLTYAYDLAGRRTGVGGSFARTGTPQAASAASYNVNNQLTQWKGASLTYDANGNLTSDGTNTYTWNARNQLMAISGAVPATFQYDPFGRRVTKTIGGMTQYLYDGANPVQEISGTTASANLLTGGVDEYFQRTDSAGARSFLTDALGSTLALADASGSLQTQYTFEPFGNTSVTGAATTNGFAYTGRELDSTGLYFYRARYYHPQLQRFIGEDPIGFLGGDINLYAYTFNDPVDWTDPNGQFIWVPVIVAGIGAVAGGGIEGIKAYKCGKRGWDLAKSIGKGAASGAVGSITGLFVATSTGNPFAAGAVAGLTSRGTKDLLNGKRSSGYKYAVDATIGGVFGIASEGLAGEVNGGQNFNPFTSSRQFGPQGLKAISGEVAGKNLDLAKEGGTLVVAGRKACEED